LERFFAGIFFKSFSTELSNPYPHLIVHEPEWVEHLKFPAFSSESFIMPLPKVHSNRLVSNGLFRPEQRSPDRCGYEGNFSMIV
jgi:hypothetical protein